MTDPTPVIKQSNASGPWWYLDGRNDYVRKVLYVVRLGFNNDTFTKEYLSLEVYATSKTDLCWHSDKHFMEQDDMNEALQESGQLFANCIQRAFETRVEAERFLEGAKCLLLCLQSKINAILTL